MKTEHLSRVQDCPLGMPGGHLGALGGGERCPSIQRVVREALQRRDL